MATDGVRLVRVLVVEDNPGDTVLVDERLSAAREARFEVRHAPTLRDALERLREQPYDVALLDLNLPDRRGVATIDAIREVSSLPVVVMSGAIDEALRLAAIEHGADDVVEKRHLHSPLLPITMLYAVERDRARSQHRELASLLDAMPDAVVVADIDGQVLYVNARALSLFDTTRESFTWSSQLFSVPRGGVKDLEIPRTPYPLRCELRVVDTVWAGQPASLALIRDVTRQRELELQLLASDRLATLGTLVAGIGHEINTPLAVVLANLEAAITSVANTAIFDEAQADFVTDALSDALDSASRIRRLVADLRMFGRSKQTLAPVNVANVLEAVVRMASGQTNYHAVVTTDFDDVPPVLGDEVRLGQVFLNLVVNAAQSIAPGRQSENRISIVLKRNSDARTLVVRIEDTGCGIPLDVQKRLFTPFYSTKPVGSGTGLGLVIAQQIVTELGGSLRFHSSVGVGTTFIVELPLHDAS